jgi:FKBP-type peptidyl-prolyl cis-trans isomerase
MSRKILITIVVVLLVVVILGAYFIFNYNKSSSQPSKNGNGLTEFEVQGMKVKILSYGSGAEAKVGDLVTTHYVGILEDGKEFDSSVGRNLPFSFQLGQGRVIRGWDLGVVGMKVGEKRELTIPPDLAYGLDGFPPTIPPQANLIYTITLLEISASLPTN